MDLETWMRERNLTDQKVADKVGVTRPYITRLRAGRVHPNLGTALKVIDYTKGAVDIRQLLPIATRPKLKRQPRAKGNAQKPAAASASQVPADA